MSLRLRDVFMSELGALRYEPIAKRIRGVIGDETVVDSTRTRLVWEPGRVVPDYAVPEEDVAGEVAPATNGAAPLPDELPRLGERPILDPSVPFSVHTADGEPVTIRARGGREASGFRLRDPELDGYVIVEFGAFDAWFEEDGTRSTASTSSTARGTSASKSTARCSPSRRGPTCSSRRTSPRGTTCRRRTSARTC
jgi:hypothetical protein